MICEEKINKGSMKIATNLKFCKQFSLIINVWFMIVLIFNYCLHTDILLGIIFCLTSIDCLTFGFWWPKMWWVVGRRRVKGRQRWWLVVVYWRLWRWVRRSTKGGLGLGSLLIEQIWPSTCYSHICHSIVFPKG